MSTKKRSDKTKKNPKLLKIAKNRRRAILYAMLSLISQIVALFYASMIIKYGQGGDCGLPEGCRSLPRALGLFGTIIFILMMASPILQWVFIAIAYKQDKESRFVKAVLGLYLVEIIIVALAMIAILFFV